MSQLTTSQTGIRSPFGQSEAVLSVGLFVVIAVMLVPLPTMLLDLLLAMNLSATILLMLVAVNTRRALELSVFPSLLLLLTLFRLALNIATTRLILLDGTAGKMVHAFGQFVVGGSLVVGLVVFLILVVVQFVVITKGAGRISEVAARFTLDSLPGKQMAIDAELNAGHIPEGEARKRRELLAQETEFYGAMDGASKFVRGDAIAGLIITAVNLLGGCLLGLGRGMSFQEAIHAYSTLTIGDGLISQLPALVIATTAGMLVTKINSDVSLGQEMAGQLLSKERPLTIGMVLLALLAVVPGLPKLPFLSLAGGIGVYLSRRRKIEPEPTQTAVTAPASAEQVEQQQLQEFLQSDRAILEVGAALIPYIETTSTKRITDRITSMRLELSRSAGVWVPPVRVRPNLDLETDAYRFLIAGRQVASARIVMDRLLAIAPAKPLFPIPGEQTTEPAFGLPALWIESANQRQAEIAGYTVVEPVTVVVTHLRELLTRHAHELLTREDVRKMIDKVRDVAPTVIEDLKPENVRPSTLHQVLTQLTAERVPLSNLVLVLESIVNYGPQFKAADELTDKVREDLGKLVTLRFLDAGGRIQVLALDPGLELGLRDLIREGQLALNAGSLDRLLDAIRVILQDSSKSPAEIALITHRTLRRPLRRLMARAFPDLGVVSYGEIPTDLVIMPVGFVRKEQVFDQPALGSNRSDGNSVPGEAAAMAA